MSGIKKIFVYGDSISMQWGIPFRKIVEEKGYCYDRYGEIDSLDLGNPKLNGESTRKMLRWISGYCPEADEMLLFNCGLHDIKRDKEGNENVPLAEYVENLTNIVQAAQHKWKAVVWISTTPVDDERHRKYYQDVIRRNEDVMKYNEAAVKVMQKWRVPVIDLYSYTVNSFMNCASIYADHVHMKKEISERQAQYIAERIGEIFHA